MNVKTMRSKSILSHIRAALQLLFYASPLSAMASVVRTRSSAALVWQLSVMSVANGSLWVLYGLVWLLPSFPLLGLFFLFSVAELSITSGL